MSGTSNDMKKEIQRLRELLDKGAEQRWVAVEFLKKLDKGEG